MAIYINGCEIVLTEARMIPVWIEHQGHRIKWHYSEKRPTRLTKKLTETPVWHVRADWKGGGAARCGRWFAVGTEMHADGGWQEIESRLKDLAPNESLKFEEWAKEDARRASEIFEPVRVKEVA